MYGSVGGVAYAAVELYCIIQTGVSVILPPSSYINEAGLNNRNTSQYNSILFNNTTNDIPQNDHKVVTECWLQTDIVDTANEIYMIVFFVINGHNIEKKDHGIVVLQNKM